MHLTYMALCCLRCHFSVKTCLEAVLKQGFHLLNTANEEDFPKIHVGERSSLHKPPNSCLFSGTKKWQRLCEWLHRLDFLA
jgi:hypothetical protein